MPPPPAFWKNILRSAAEQVSTEYQYSACVRKLVSQQEKVNDALYLQQCLGRFGVFGSVLTRFATAFSDKTTQPLLTN